MNITAKSLFPILALLLTPLMAHADLIKTGSAYTRTILMTSSSDHITGATGLTLTVKLAKAGGVPATITDTVTEQGSGRYAISLVTADTGTLGALDLTITATGADPSDTHDQVVLDVPGGSVASVTASVVASNFVASPTLSQIQGGVPTLAQITALFPAEYLTSAEQAYLAKLDATVSSRMATFSYTAPPSLPADYLSTAEQAKIALLDAAISTRLAASSYTAGAGGDSAGVTTLLTRVPGTIQPQTGDSYAAIAALPTAASIVTAIKADSLFSILLNRQKQRFVYVPSTHSYQPLLDDGTTVFGSPLILTVDANGNITNR